MYGKERLEKYAKMCVELPAKTMVHYETHGKLKINMMQKAKSEILRLEAIEEKTFEDLLEIETNEIIILESLTYMHEYRRIMITFAIMKKNKF